jgi:putative nucleotidyltransferase with HDIG domain
MVGRGLKGPVGTRFSESKVTIMLKRIQIQHLTLGMYLHEFCGSWMDHPFWRAKFLLKDPKDLARIRETAVAECWIDTSKGLDVALGTASVSREEVDAQIETDFSRLEDLPPLQVSLPPPPPPPVRDRSPTDMSSELKMAAAVCVRSKKAVISMFHEARMGRAVDSASAQSLVEEISDSVTRNPGALISLARLKTADDYTYMHSVAVCALMVALAKQLQLNDDQTRLAGMAGLLHDLGKAAIPLSVLNKPGKLTDKEFTVVRSHPVEGYHMLKEGGSVPDAVLDACLHHHEKMDGTGYPDKLKGENISVIARMTAICDVYDAVTSDRPYKSGWDPSESLRRMAEWTNDHFDLRMFQAFVKSIGIYPVGSLVRLTSGRVGVVTEQAPTALTMPTVKVFYSTKSDLRIPPELVNLAAPGCNEKIVAREDPEKWRFPDLNELWSGFAEKAW